MSSLIAKVYSVGLLVIGISHLLHAKLWTEFFVETKRNNRFTPLLIGMFTLPAGLLIVCGHNVWGFNLRVIITLAGWVMTVKSIIYLLNPRSIDRVIPEQEESPRKFVVVGSLMTLLGLLLVYSSFFRPDP